GPAQPRGRSAPGPRDPGPVPRGSPPPRPAGRPRTGQGTHPPCRRGRAGPPAGTGRSAGDPLVSSPRPRHTPPNVTVPLLTSTGQNNPKTAAERQPHGVGCFSDTSLRRSGSILTRLPAVTSGSAVSAIRAPRQIPRINLAASISSTKE